MLTPTATTDRLCRQCGRAYETRAWVDPIYCSVACIRLGNEPVQRRENHLRERECLADAIRDAGLARTGLVALCAGYLWRHSGLRAALDFVESVG